MASGGAELCSDLLSGSSVGLLGADQASLYESALSLCVQTASDLENKKSPSASNKHQFEAMKGTVWLSQAQLGLDFGARLAATLDSSLRVSSSYSLEKHLGAANSVLEQFRNAACLADKVSGLSISASTDQEAKRAKSLALLFSGRLYGQLAEFFSKPQTTAHVMAAASSDWEKRARLNMKLAKRSYGKVIELSGGGKGLGERARSEREALVVRLKGRV